MREEGVEGRVSIVEAILARCRRTPSGCLLWQRGCTGDGYGAISIEGKKAYVHRVVFEQTHGPIPEGHQIDHTCANEPGLRRRERRARRRCCNPEHLESVPQRENIHRSSSTTLTAIDVAEIRASSETDEALGKRYGVRGPTINRARNGRTWKEAA